MKTLGSIRITVGILLLLVASVGWADAPPAPATTDHVLVYANANDYTTTIVTVNPTDETITGRVLYDKVWPPLVDVLEPHSVSRYPWGEEGVNVDSVTLDARLIVYVEIVTPLQTIARIHPLQPIVAPASFYDLPRLIEGDGLESHLVLVADSHGQVNVTEGDSTRSLYLGPETGVVLELTGSRAEITVGYDTVYPPLPGPSKLYAFAIVVHDATGAITVVDPVQ